MVDVTDPGESGGGESSADDSQVVDLQPLIKRKNRKTLSNYETLWSAKGQPYKVGLDAQDILERLNAIRNQWPRRIGRRLFIPPNGNLVWLDRPANFFGWLSSEGIAIEWSESATGGITKAEFLSALQGSAKEHVGFSKLPHFPPKEGYYYADMDLPEESHGAFEKLLEFFNPASAIDADILKAAFMTLFWGGPSGARPAFVFTGLDDDKEGGRGVGKTTLTDVMAELAGGAIDFSAKLSDIEQFKKRVLTSNGQRVIRFDNVKSSRLSNGDIEAMITAAQVSGHVMFHGDGSLANDFTYLFTFNDASFSKDMAQRAIPIRLNRPVYSGDWTESVFAFLRANRLAIIAGIRDALSAEPIRTSGYLRFGLWSREVLARATAQPDIAKAIQGLQGGMDDDEETREEIGAIILYQMAKYRVAEYGLWDGVHATTTKCTFMIRSTLLTQWISQGLNMKMSARSAMSLLARSKVTGFRGEKFHDGYRYLLWSTAPTDDPPGAYRVFEDSRTKQNLAAEDFIKFRV